MACHCLRMGSVFVRTFCTSFFVKLSKLMQTVPSKMNLVINVVAVDAAVIPGNLKGSIEG